jgi:hypothetical protein
VPHRTIHSVYTACTAQQLPTIQQMVTTTHGCGWVYRTISTRSVALLLVPRAIPPCRTACTANQQVELGVCTYSTPATHHPADGVLRMHSMYGHSVSTECSTNLPIGVVRGARIHLRVYLTPYFGHSEDSMPKRAYGIGALTAPTPHVWVLHMLWVCTHSTPLYPQTTTLYPRTVGGSEQDALHYSVYTEYTTVDVHSPTLILRV